MSGSSPLAMALDASDGIEGEDDVDLAVGEQLLHRRIVLRKRLAAAPQQRVELVQIGKKRRGHFSKDASSTGFASTDRSATSSDKHLLQE